MPNVFTISAGTGGKSIPPATKRAMTGNITDRLFTAKASSRKQAASSGSFGLYESSAQKEYVP